MSQIDKVEIHLAQLERTVEQLSHVVAEQWRIIDSQGNSLRNLVQRFVNLEEQQLLNTPIKPPPHW